MALSDRGYACVALDNPKYDANVGGAMRAAFCYEAQLVVISGHRFQREATDTMHSWRHMPLIRVEADVLSVIPFSCVPVAVELVDDARPLHAYTHPERAFYVFGSEDATLGRRILSRCRDVIYIPTSSV